MCNNQGKDLYVIKKVKICKYAGKYENTKKKITEYVPTYLYNFQENAFIS